MLGFLILATQKVCKGILTIKNGIVDINSRTVDDGKDIYVDHAGYVRLKDNNRSVYPMTVNGDRCLVSNVKGEFIIERNFSEEEENKIANKNKEKVLIEGGDIYLYKNKNAAKQYWTRQGINYNDVFWGDLYKSNSTNNLYVERHLGLETWYFNINTLQFEVPSASNNSYDIKKINEDIKNNVLKITFKHDAYGGFDNIKLKDYLL